MCVGHLVLPERQGLRLDVDRRSLLTSQVLNSYRSGNSHLHHPSDSMYYKTLEKILMVLECSEKPQLQGCEGHANITSKEHSKAYESRDINAAVLLYGLREPSGAQAARCPGVLRVDLAAHCPVLPSLPGLSLYLQYEGYRTSWYRLGT